MTVRVVAILILSSTLLIRCAAQPTPRPGASCVVLNVEAKPKAGIKKQVSRVPVYDAAPTSGKASGEFEQVDYDSLDDIVVWLEPAPKGAVATSKMNLEIDAAEKPSEKVHPASVGQEVVFRNLGSAPLSIYSVSDGNDFDLPAIAPGAEAKFTVRGPGLIEVLGDPAQPPIAQIYAVASPWVTSAKSGQAVVFNDVTPGSYRVVGWHPRLPGSTVNVSLAPNQVLHQSLAISVNNLSAVAMLEP